MAGLTKEERQRAADEARRALAREKESDEQKWLRGAIRDEIKDTLTEMFSLDEDDDGGEGAPPKKSGPQGGSVSFLDALGLGGRKTG